MMLDTISEALEIITDIDRGISRIQGVEGNRIDEDVLERSRRGIYGRDAFLDVIGNFQRLEEIVEDIGFLLDSVYGEGFTFRLSSLAGFPEDIYVRYCEGRDGIVRCVRFRNEELDRLLGEISDRVYEVTGKRCWWKTGDKYYPLTVFNSISNCIHTAFLGLTKKLGNIVERKEKVTIFSSASSGARELCRAWDEFTEKFNELGIYGISDYENLKCIAFDDKVHLVVGSAPGHTAKVLFDTGEILYYDDDNDVKQYIESMFKSIGALCTTSNEGVSCIFRDRDRMKEKIKDIAYILANATSLDIQLTGIINVWSDIADWMHSNYNFDSLIELSIDKGVPLTVIYNAFHGV